MPEQCSTCRFWRAIDQEVGECRRFPPSSAEDDVNMGAPMFPTTTDTIWCGEFQRLPESQGGVEKLPD